MLKNGEIDMLTAFIIDDEMMARDELIFLLQKGKQVNVIGEAEDSESAWEQIQRKLPDVVFLDIQLANESGIDLAEKMLSLNPQPEIVFATAYDEYALKAFELNAIDYILKPFEEERIQQTIEKMQRTKRVTEQESTVTGNRWEMVETMKKLTILVEDRIYPISIEQIYYLSSVEGKTLIVTAERHYKINEPLIKLERKLIHTPVKRVHRSFLVNLEAIEEIQPWFHSTYLLMMKDKSKVPVSRTFVKELRAHFDF
jgi:two-component system response regulator LytT